MNAGPTIAYAKHTWLGLSRILFTAGAKAKDQKDKKKQGYRFFIKRTSRSFLLVYDIIQMEIKRKTLYRIQFLGYNKLNFHKK